MLRLTRSELNLITGTSVEAISEERASRSLYRIQLLSKIREEVEYRYFILITLNKTTKLRTIVLAVQLPLTSEHFIPVQFQELINYIRNNLTVFKALLPSQIHSQVLAKNVHRFYLMRSWMSAFNWPSHLPAFLTGGSVGSTTRTCLLV